MGAPDEIIHQSVRLQIAASLYARERSEATEFKTLASLLRLTNGNLASHIAALEKAGYVIVHKDFVGKKQRTRIALSLRGRKAFEHHIAFLNDVIDSAQQVTKPGGRMVGLRGLRSPSRRREA